MHSSAVNKNLRVFYTVTCVIFISKFVISLIKCCHFIMNKVVSVLDALLKTQCFDDIIYVVTHLPPLFSHFFTWWVPPGSTGTACSAPHTLSWVKERGKGDSEGRSEQN